jgi:hypothetical protein
MDADTIEPGRLLRATQLRVERIGLQVYRVTGGREPHRVDTAAKTCNCRDHLKRKVVCMHLIAARIVERDPVVFDAAVECLRVCMAAQQEVG